MIDIALARRQLIDSDPRLVQMVTHAHFEALHGYLNNAATFTEAAAHDSGKAPADAETMLCGIRFAALGDNVHDWLRQSLNQDARIAGPAGRVFSSSDSEQFRRTRGTERLMEMQSVVLDLRGPTFLMPGSHPVPVFRRHLFVFA